MSLDARRVAFDILRRVETRDAWASVLLRTRGAGAGNRDLALATEIVYGVLRRRLWIDHVIAAFSSRPPARIDADLLHVLRIAIYQILWLDRVPDHAAVSEAVTLARARSRRKPAAAAAFVNALLRTLLRQKNRIPVPPDPAAAADPAAALSLSRSFPEWLTRRWIARFGRQETTGLLDAMNEPAPVVLRACVPRVSTARLVDRLAEEGVSARPSRWAPDTLVAEAGVPHRTAAFAQGDFYIQDEASVLAALVAGARPGMQVLDACAAPGGKALVIEGQVGADGRVVAVDRQAARIARLRENRARLRLPPGLLIAADMTRAAPLRSDLAFDVVVVDAPCSGTGVIRRHPELRYRLRPEDLARLAATQSSLLAACAERVRPGGALVYAVCSLEPEEGPDRVEAFLRAQPAFRVEDPRADLPPSARDLVAATDFGSALVTLPHRDRMDGFFAVRMRREGG